MEQRANAPPDERVVVHYEDGVAFHFGWVSSKSEQRSIWVSMVEEFPVAAGGAKTWPRSVAGNCARIEAPSPGLLVIAQNPLSKRSRSYMPKSKQRALRRRRPANDGFLRLHAGGITGLRHREKPESDRLPQRGAKLVALVGSFPNSAELFLGRDDERHAVGQHEQRDEAPENYRIPKAIRLRTPVHGELLSESVQVVLIQK